MSETPSTAEPSADPSFGDLQLDEKLVRAIEELGFDAPTPIQLRAIGPLREGRDVLARARTGSGKTAAFGLPMLHRLASGGKTVRALVMTPTRELALQVTDALRSYAKNLPIQIVTVYGGAAYAPQLDALRRGATVVVGTPGRLVDLVDRGALNLSTLEVLVLDEADEMLRMGFVEDVEHLISSTPPTRQVALFSATVPEPIRRIAHTHLRDPVEISVEARAMTTDHVTQQVIVVPRPRKIEALCRWMSATEREGTLVFARTRLGCAEIAEALVDRGFHADALHGDLSQPQREYVMGRFRSKQLDVLVATDVAARGLDVEHLSHVVNLDLPDDAEVYVHRIGRTARAGRSGVALTFVAPGERDRMRRIARTLRLDLNEITVPTDGEIARFRQDKLLVALAEVPAAALADAEALLARWGKPELAIAALALLCRDRRIPLATPTETRTAKGRIPDAELFVSIGSRNGLRPQDLVGALANGRGVPGHEVGKIRILERKSFVGLPSEVIDRLLAERPTLPLCGQEVKLARARPSPET